MPGSSSQALEPPPSIPGSSSRPLEPPPFHGRVWSFEPLGRSLPKAGYSDQPFRDRAPRFPPAVDASRFRDPWCADSSAVESDDSSAESSEYDSGSEGQRQREHEWWSSRARTGTDVGLIESESGECESSSLGSASSELTTWERLERLDRNPQSPIPMWWPHMIFALNLQLPKLL